MTDDTRLARALVALDGLSVGDAFGEKFFASLDLVVSLISQRAEPRAPWAWTDDTAMALSVVAVLGAHGGVDRDALAEAFVERWAREPWRGYGGGAHEALGRMRLGEEWRGVAASLFDGTGSMGNGAAMRVAPVGAYFADDLDDVVLHALASAEPTHAHPEGIAGAIAVGVAAAVAHRTRGLPKQARAAALYDEVLRRTPRGETRDGIEAARAVPSTTPAREAARTLGNGSKVTSPDTVPFTILCAARHVDDFVEAMWATVSALGDRDTTCAIVGGIVATGGAPIPQEFLQAREPLPLR